MDEQAYPEFYVKLDPFFPVFPKPYSYYQDAAFEEKFALQDSASRESFPQKPLRKAMRKNMAKIPCKCIRTPSMKMM